MRVSGSSKQVSGGRNVPVSRWPRIMLWLVGAVAVVLAGVLLLRPEYVRRVAVGVDRNFGPAFRSYDQSLADSWSIAIGSYLREAIDGIPAVPELVIDVPFKGMTKIYAKREAALERGILVQGDDDFVKGKIRIDGRTVPVKLRLKGDWNDHIAGRKWSFRIQVRDDEKIFGMRVFSIQGPNTRGFQSEFIFHELVRRFDIIAPRNLFVNVSINGDSMGLMQVEEFFAKEMLEYNRRKEGVIIRFDESLAWETLDDGQIGGPFASYSNAPIDAFGSGQIAKSPDLARQYKVAAGLLRALLDGKLAPSQVFDVQRMAAYVAVCDFLGAWHALVWHNLRFYLNPISMRLEPISFDADLQNQLTSDASAINFMTSTNEPMMVNVMKDPVMWEAYTKALAQLATMTRDGEIAELIDAVETEHLAVLRSEFRMLGNYPQENLQQRVDKLLERALAATGKGAANPNLLVGTPKDIAEYPILAHFGVVQLENRPFLQIENAIPRDVIVRSAAWIKANSEQRQNAVREGAFPVELPPRGIGSKGRRVMVELNAPPDPEGWTLQVTASLPGRNWQKDSEAVAIYPALPAPVIPDGDPAKQLAAHPFLSLDQQAKRFTVKPGTWEVQESIVIPSGYSLEAGAATILEFADTALLVSHGTIRFVGSSDAPVVLRPVAGNKSWPGMIVMEAPETSLLEHVIVSDTDALKLGDWVLTGGVNFYISPVEIRNSELRDSHGEDALNIIRTSFEISGLLVNGTASDAFDSDFSTGSVTESRFEEIGAAGGGDAIDISGSKVSVANVQFKNISDKALSVGERSEMVAQDISIDTAGTGAASKDGSRLTLTNANMANVKFAGLTAYIKKPEYESAEVIADKVTIESADQSVIAQSGSRISVDGTAVATQDVDVDALYETVMRKGMK